jgi:hypothetical protein
MAKGKISEGLPPSLTSKKRRFADRQAMIFPNGCLITWNLPPEMGVTWVAA